jgi:TolB-like protein
MKFWNELKRRNVFKVGAAYLIVAWLITQVLATVEEPLNLPGSIATIVILLLTLGFPIALILAWAYELTPEGIKSATEVDRREEPSRHAGQRFTYGITALLAIAVVYLVADRFLLSDNTLPVAVNSLTNAPGPINRAPDSLAVLPFENLSSDADQDYFSDGVSLELRDGLQNAGSIYVPPRDLVLPFKNSVDSLSEIAEGLGVEHLLTGSIRKAGETVRITATLIRATDGTRIWTNDYNGTLEQIFDFQSAIASTVIEAITGTFDQNELELFPGGTDNDAAYDLYLRAESQPSVFSPTGEGRNGLYRQALALDPEFAQAQIALASSLLVQAGFAYGTPAWEEIANAARRAVERAVELAPELPGTLLLVAQRNMDQLQWAAAESAYRMALEKSAGRDFDVNDQYGSFLLRVGRLSDAVSYTERARRLAPLLARPVATLTIAYDALGSTARVRELQDSVTALVGGDAGIVVMPEFWRQLYVGNLAEAQRLLGPTFSSEPILGQLEDRDATIAALYAASESPEGAGATFQSAIAMLAAQFDEPELAVSAWRRTLQGSNAFLIFHWTPLMTPVRTHPDSKDLLRELRLVEYWQQAGWPELCRPMGDDDFECR